MAGRAYPGRQAVPRRRGGARDGLAPQRSEALRLRAQERRFALARDDDGPDALAAGAQFLRAAGDLAEHHPRRIRRPAQPVDVGASLRRLMPKRFTLTEAERLLP